MNVKIKKILSSRNICIVTVMGVVISLIPLLALSGVNRATGDDLGYGLLTHLAWVDTRSLLEVIKAIGATIRNYYYGWQGTWFSIALFSVQPEVFSPNAYWVVAPIMIGLFFLSSYKLLYYISGKLFKLDRYSCCFMAITYFFLTIQFIPSTKSGIFWYNGCAHYLIPYTMCLGLIYALFRYREKYEKKYLCIIFIVLTLLSGANYQAALLGLIVTVLMIGEELLICHNKKVLLLLCPILTFMIGLLISIMAPGNKVRGGEELGFSVDKIIATIGKSFLYAFKDAKTYIVQTPIILVIIFLVMASLIHAMLERTEQEIIVKHPVITVCILICVWAAMQAPAIYADVSVSGGVPNTNWQVFLLMIWAILYIVSERLSAWMYKKSKSYHKAYFSSIVVGVFLLFVFRYDLKESTSYECIDYIQEGQAQDFKESMEYYDSILQNDSIKDVVLPPVNDYQGPLMYMPVIEDENAFTNSVVRDFYRKDRVVMKY